LGRWLVGLRQPLQRAAFAATGRFKLARAQAWYSFTAPQSIEDVDRADVRHMFLWLRSRHGTSGRLWRPHYAWGILTSAMVARALGMERMSAIEFGVAGGSGLVAMERAASDAESLLGVGIDVVGFDTGTGMPSPVDHRDAPFAVHEGYWEMDVEALRARLGRAELVLGPVAETVPAFMLREHSPIGFVGVDLDYYSSTMDALAVLDAGGERLLPRVVCYFNGVMWWPWAEFNGQRAAIKDFNAGHERRKLSPIYGLRYSLPRSEFRLRWPDMMYVAEIFDHDLYDADQRVAPADQSLAD
jgi:hypothetical protein